MLKARPPRLPLGELVQPLLALFEHQVAVLAAPLALGWRLVRRRRASARSKAAGSSSDPIPGALMAGP